MLRVRGPSELRQGCLAGRGARARPLAPLHPRVAQRMSRLIDRTRALLELSGVGVFMERRFACVLRCLFTHYSCRNSYVAVGGGA